MSDKQSFFQRVFGSGKKGEKEPTPQEAIQRLRDIEEMLVKKSDFLEKKVGSELQTAKKHGTKNKRGTEDDVVWEDLVQPPGSTGDADNTADDDNDEVDFSYENDLYKQIPNPYTEEEYQRLWASDVTAVTVTLVALTAWMMQVALQALKRKKRYEKQLQQIDGTLSTIEFQREALENASTNTEVLKAMGSAAKALKKAHNNMDVDKVHDLMDDVAEQQEIANEISDAISNPVGFGQDMDEDDLLEELEELEQEELEEKLLDVGPSVSDELPSVPTAEPVKPKPVAAEEDDDLRELQAWAS